MYAIRAQLYAGRQQRYQNCIGAFIVAQNSAILHAFHNKGSQGVYKRFLSPLPFPLPSSFVQPNMFLHNMRTGKKVVYSKQNTLDRFVRHPQELLVILLSMLLQGVIGRGVHHIVARRGRTAMAGVHNGENGELDDRGQEREKVRESGDGKGKEKAWEKVEEEAREGGGQDDEEKDPLGCEEWEDNTEARRLNERIRRELHDEALVEELAAVVGKFCERTREALHFDSKEFVANMLVLDKIKLLIHCKRAEGRAEEENEKEREKEERTRSEKGRGRGEKRKGKGKGTAS